MSSVGLPLISEVQLDGAGGGSFRAVVQTEHRFGRGGSAGAGGGGSAADGWQRRVVRL